MMGAEVVVFPDPQLVVIQRLQAALGGRPEAYAADVFVGDEVPTQRRDKMVIVSLNGGPRLDLVRQVARIAVETWGRSRVEARDLARLVHALLPGVADTYPALHVNAQFGPYSLPDESRQAKTYQTCEVMLRGTAV